MPAYVMKLLEVSGSEQNLGFPSYVHSSMYVLIALFVHDVAVILMENLLSVQDIFTKNDGHIPLDLFHSLAKIKFGFFVCVLVSRWFICCI